MRAQIAILPDGRRHFHDGPIDLIIEAFGPQAAVAYDAAAARFATILNQLCLELPRLRAASGARPQGVVARRMVEATAPFGAERFITPMAAVAGAVAEETLAAMTEAADLDRAYVNNGGDIALHLAAPSPHAGESWGGAPLGLHEPLSRMRRLPASPTLPHNGEGGQPTALDFVIGLVARPDRPALIGKARITARDAARGVATSGWRGRSFSLGIADAVTVIAGTAALADAAATLIANAVDLPGHPAIVRAAARSRDPQSDLGERLVTLDVHPLGRDQIAEALAAGVAEAEHWLARGLIAGAALSLAGETRLVGFAANPYTSAVPALELEPAHALG